MSASVKDDEGQRGRWSQHLDAIMSYIGSAVGLGSIWRFPYLAYKNGGASFLLPYFLMMAFTGMPMFFLELAIGQYSSKGPLTAWNISPFFKGIGYSAVSMCAIPSIYYGTLMAYIVYFLYQSFTTQLPWSTCNNPWNTLNCLQIANSSTQSKDSNHTNGQELFQIISRNNRTSNWPLMGNYNKSTYPAEEYWTNHVLGMSDGIDDFGNIQWHLVLCSLVSWMLIFISIIKGIKSSGKVWRDAATQTFYCLGPCWGVLISYASFTKFNTNSCRDSVFVSTFSCLMTVYFGLAVFSVIGLMGHEMGIPIQEVMRPGPDLVFIVYPEALTRFPVAPLWSVIFFIMLLCVSMGAQIGHIHVIRTALNDLIPETFLKRRTEMTGLVCVVFFILGLPLTSQSGIYTVTLLDWTVGSFPLLIIGILEVSVIAYIYGFRQFSLDIKTMMGTEPNLYWLFCWIFATPVILSIVLVFTILTYHPVSLDDYIYPLWGQGICWTLWIFILVWLPFWMIMKLYKVLKGRTCNLSCQWMTDILHDLLQPSSDWGPYLGVDRYSNEKYIFDNGDSRNMQ